MKSYSYQLIAEAISHLKEQEMSPSASLRTLFPSDRSADEINLLRAPQRGAEGSASFLRAAMRAKETGRPMMSYNRETGKIVPRSQAAIDRAETELSKLKSDPGVPQERIDTANEYLRSLKKNRGTLDNPLKPSNIARGARGLSKKLLAPYEAASRENPASPGITGASMTDAQRRLIRSAGPELERLNTTIQQSGDEAASSPIGITAGALALQSRIANQRPRIASGELPTDAPEVTQTLQSGQALGKRVGDYALKKSLDIASGAASSKYDIPQTVGQAAAIEGLKPGSGVKYLESLGMIPKVPGPTELPGYLERQQQQAAAAGFKPDAQKRIMSDITDVLSKSPAATTAALDAQRRRTSSLASNLKRLGPQFPYQRPKGATRGFGYARGPR